MAPPGKEKRVRQGLARLFLRLPYFGRRSLRKLLTQVEETPRSQLPAELQQLQAALKQVPKDQRLGLLEAGLRGKIPQPEELPSRSMRRAAARRAPRPRR